MSNPDAGPVSFFAGDHRECDDAWAAIESAPAPARAALWATFKKRMERHLAMEEEVLFPAFEAATGMRGMGPTEVMRHEHAQMRALLTDMESRAAAGDFDGLLDQGDTLMMLIQQHNAKEEGMLYPMAENVLGSGWAAVAQKLKAY